ncbi:Biopolymer transport protein ExbD/TolR [Candidatus Koribacter versatilis Ellin345]|uniref:Biopolymer transport protein ExbD/TolR n=1 Tax=Koribacter versatilis (strain Ellin345) TaxID=204669 RepID=Q1IIV0_KORVE|nr:biopolymer transporter ExbD [Candidatus Koribacter versatilis]ABF43200.1 Biopolymer transport protein ExbD/TolR [Candidatus Koribacter versatilis Ellin345]
MRTQTYSHRIFANAFQMSMLVVLLVLWTIVFCYPLPYSHGVRADLPKSNFPQYQARALSEDSLSITLFRDGIFYFRSEHIPPEELTARLTAATLLGAERKVYVRADARTRYEHVKEIVDAAESAGIRNVVFLAEQRKSASAK